MDQTKQSPTPTISSEQTSTSSLLFPTYRASTNPPSYKSTSIPRPANTARPRELMEVDASDLEAGTERRRKKEPPDVAWRIVVVFCVMAGILAIAYAVVMAIRKRHKALALTRTETQREKEAFRQLESALEKLWEGRHHWGKTDRK